MSKQACTTPLHHKIANRADRLQAIMESLFEVARCNLDPCGNEEWTQEALVELERLADEYGVVWLDETAKIFKVLNHEGDE